ncbi:porin [Candidatus Nitrospira bockiana]
MKTVRARASRYLACLARLISVIVLVHAPTWAQSEQHDLTSSPPPRPTQTAAKPAGAGIGQPDPAVPPAPAAPRASAGRATVLESTPLEDVLLEKGIISMDDWLRIKAEEERRIAERTAEMQFVSSPRWYERINVNGYAQLRYTMKDNAKLDLHQGESTSTNHPLDFFFRRVRLVFQGQVSERLAFFLQFALEGDGFRLQNNELVDMYGDYFLTRDRAHRVRFGLHRVPNSFDTYRSSSQRQELDRAEAIQSGAPGERDLGLAYYWSPKVAQERYARLATYHNGPGDYGVFGIMVYNGQGRSATELNHDKHLGAKLSYPFELPNGRLLEMGVLGFTGEYVVSGSGIIAPTATASSSTVARCVNPLRGGGCPIHEERVTGYIWTPPQPWGFLAEYTVGRGPERDANDVITEQSLHGGYAQIYYTWRYSDVGMLTPYIRYGYYRGGFKNQRGAAADNTMWNFGLVWEPDTHLRLVSEYSIHDRLNVSQDRFGLGQEEIYGQMLRFQIQWFWN